MTKFFEIFNEKTKNKYSFLRLNTLSVNKETATLDICFVMPYDYFKDSFSKDDVREIENICKEILPSQFGINIRFTKCLLGDDVVKKYVYNFFAENYLSLLNEINFEKIVVKIETKNVEIIIPLASSILNFCENVNIDKKLVEYLNACYSENSKIVFEESGAFDVSEIVKRDIKHAVVYSTTVRINNKMKFFGAEIVGEPKYIKTFVKAYDEICVCGKISNIVRKIAKEKKTVYYNFKIDDTTGQMNCLFASRSKTSGALDGISDGREFLFQGRYVEDSYSNGFKLIVKSIALCVIDFDSINAQAELMLLANKKREPIEPKPFEIKYEQLSIDQGVEKSKFFKENVFVVFDLETTGTDPKNDKIIEIGAVKIVGGEFVDYYSTLIDPRISIPNGASLVNNIYDRDLVDAPFFEDIMQSFIDYCEGCVMVAHNANFDMSFMRNACISNGAKFENKYFDTLEMSRKARPKQQKHKLDVMCRTFDIPLTNAHRAYFDAEATAKLFIKLADELHTEIDMCRG